MKIDITGLTVKDIMEIDAKLDMKFNPSILRAYDHNKSNQKLLELMLKPNLYKSLKCDSGTFVLNMRGKLERCESMFKIYCNFIKKFGNKLDYYINFDAVFLGENAFPVNKGYQERMEAMGLNPVFVMHSFEDYEVDYVLRKKPKVVSIASAMLKNDAKFAAAIPVVDKMYANGILVHLLGCASYRRLNMALRAWSCDASSYGRWASFNRMIFFSEREGKEVTLSRSSHDGNGEPNDDYFLNPSMLPRLKEYEQFIKPLYPVEEVVGSHKALLHANAYSMYCLEKRISEIQKAHNIEFPE